MSLGIDVRNLTVRFGDVAALDDMSFSLTGGKIYGLVGRNGSGKTTLLSVLAAFRPVTIGKVLVGGAEPFENGAVTEQVCLVRESGIYIDGCSVKDTFAFASMFRPNWDHGYAARLADLFELPMKKYVNKLSRGQKSAVGITIGLASRAPVTMLDESYLGLDAPTRYAFYDELLADYMEHPRTFIISSHLIEEVGRLFEEVLVLDKGRLTAHEEIDTLLASGAAVTGPASAVDEFTAALPRLSVLAKRELGRTKSTTVYGQITEQERRWAQQLGLELGPVGLQDLVVHMTDGGHRDGAVDSADGGDRDGGPDVTDGGRRAGTTDGDDAKSGGGAADSAGTGGRGREADAGDASGRVGLGHRSDPSRAEPSHRSDPSNREDAS